MRHGESVLNKQNRFGGWIDVPLADSGMKDAREATKLLEKEKMEFDVGYTSVLMRSIQTFNIISEEMQIMWIPVTHSWRLNERHYGAL
jgi:2,3-bisphosphoglycerate-dependent phosphoglycerate mutase